MGLFNKKKEVKEILKLPSLSGGSVFPELPKKEEMKPLPTLPSFSSFPQLSSMQMSKPLEFESMRPVMKPSIMENEGENISETLKEPVFVKIDRYREALEEMSTIKRKLQETSSLLERIKDTRAREENEINNWSQEINTIKEKIEEINKKLFSA